MTLADTLFQFFETQVLAQIRNLDQTEGNFWKRKISIWTIFINTPSGTRMVCLLLTCFGQHTGNLKKHAGYEGQACPESRGAGEEKKSFLASYQILQ